jgi:uncharacterized protein
MEKKLINIISERLSISVNQVENTIELFEGGATIPFISRYRKEATGSLDEVEVGRIKEQKEKLEELEKRKTAILKSIGEQELLTPELEQKILNTFDLSVLEDIYLPYKPKRRTKATIAREKGLEPLAKILMKQNERDPESKAADFINDNVEDVEDALAGARDIIAEWVSEDRFSRNAVRREFEQGAVISSSVVKGKEEEGAKYQDYFEWEESLKRCPSHRLLAMRRGEKEGFLKITIRPDKEQVLKSLERISVRGNTASSEQVALAVQDSYKRLLEPSIETEFSNLSKSGADHEAIDVFAENLRQLLLASPLGQKRVLAIDPGYRTGCKVVCLDAQGNLLHNETIYPHPPQKEVKQ